MKKIKVFIGDNEFIFEMVNNRISDYWYQSYIETIKRINDLDFVETNFDNLKKPEIYEFNGFKTENELTTELKLVVDRINFYWWDYKKEILITDSEVKLNQDYLNYLHHFFEVYRGSIYNPHDFFSYGTEIKYCLERLNVLIHECEVKLLPKKFYQITVTFDNAVKIPLRTEDYSYFEIFSNFGGMYANYCEVGKDIIDMFNDKDDYIDSETVRPLRWMSPDFNINLTEYVMNDDLINHRKNFLQNFEIWKQSNKQKFLDIGIDLYAPEAAIGKLKIAQLTQINNINLDEYRHSEVIALIEKNRKITKVLINN